MLNYRCSLMLRDEFVLKAEYVAVNVVCKMYRRNICLKHFNQLKKLTSSQLCRYNGVNGLFKQQNKFNIQKKSIISFNALNGVSSFSNCNISRHFSSSSPYFNDSSFLKDSNALSLDDSSVSASTSVGSVSVPSSFSSEINEIGSSSELLDPSLESLGLGGWTPPGLVQSGLEYLHVTCGLPWWACIVCGTVIIRTVVLPLVIRHQKGMIVMSNAMPQLQLLQMKMMSARDSGNVIEAARYSNEMVNFVKTKKINPLKSLAIPLIQMPFFLSFFFGLRGMADLPVDSLHNGGLWWFSDLTVYDPFYILPIATCVTMFVTIELGLETGMSPDQMGVKYVKYFIRSMPFIMFPVIIHFPGALLVYWLSTNMYSLIQSNVLRVPTVRKYFGFEAPADNAACLKLLEKLQKNPDKGFKEGFRESVASMNLSQDIKERKSLEMEEFKKIKDKIGKKMDGK